jgi:hypothetical protein
VTRVAPVRQYLIGRPIPHGRFKRTQERDSAHYGFTASVEPEAELGGSVRRNGADSFAKSTASEPFRVAINRATFPYSRGCARNPGPDDHACSEKSDGVHPRFARSSSQTGGRDEKTQPLIVLPAVEAPATRVTVAPKTEPQPVSKIDQMPVSLCWGLLGASAAILILQIWNYLS